ncbi:hypothetical protein L1887_39363 [Cichorium endivia]|nr:hypothetical protein L1887_39363 [Cichorium endivia]
MNCHFIVILRIFNKLTGPIPKLPKNLIELEIKSNSLSGSLPKPSFNELTQLEVVELSDISFTGVIPVGLLQPSLQQVNLANNGFTAIEISKPINSNLIAVNVGYNKIVGFLSVNLSAYPMLSSLSLRYNKLYGPIPPGTTKWTGCFWTEIT